ncbi:hypothetical protein ACH42_06775 [Endozoicomonas sp. (ex Bugula neritina AB1)]|nr:hypothetical protein ACH42_06775 [Endozoicomonas sp. (ex Bugula neritina AB1)]
METFNIQAALANAEQMAETGIQKPAESLSAAKEVAQDFEAMMIEEMLKSMRKANEVLAEDGLLNSREQDFWQDFQDSQLAIELSRERGLGLSDQVLEQIKRIQG